MKSFTLLLLVCCLALAFTPVHAAQRRHRRSRRSSGSASGNKNVAALQGKLNDLRAKKKALQGQLHQNKAMTHQTLQEIAQVDQQLTDVENALEQTTQQLGQSKVQQKQVAVQLDDATKQLATVTAEVKERLRRIYNTGQVSPVTVLIGNHTGGELAARADTMAQIARSDHQVFDQYRSLRTEVAQKKQAADQLVVKISNLAQRQQAEQNQLQDVRQQKSQKVKVLEQQAGELEEAIAQFEQDEHQLTSQINEFMRHLSQTGESMPAFTGRFIRPVPGAITSGFGYRYHPILHITRLHAGVDFHAPTGTPVHAAASGIVAAAQYMRGYGNTVMIAHGSDLSTVYGHLSRIYVHSGERVAQGQVIAASGATGLATGPHLHFEIRVHGKPVNPLGHI